MADFYLVPQGTAYVVHHIIVTKPLTSRPGPEFSYNLRYIVSFGLVDVALINSARSTFQTGSPHTITKYIAFYGNIGETGTSSNKILKK